jgi:hypothetical protein
VVSCIVASHRKFVPFPSFIRQLSEFVSLRATPVRLRG